MKTTDTSRNNLEAEICKGSLYLLLTDDMLSASVWEAPATVEADIAKVQELVTALQQWIATGEI